MKKITVACVLRTPAQLLIPTTKKKKFVVEDVLRLKKGVENFLSIDHTFVCLTDETDIPVNTIPLIGNTPGWWAKIELFRSNLFSGPVLYIDLDTAICNELDTLIDSCAGMNFVTTKEPGYGRLASGIMYWDGDYSHLWDMYCKNPGLIQDKYKKKPFIGDQAYIADNVGLYSFFTDNPIISETWFCRMTAKTTPHVDTRFLIAAGILNKLYDDRYRNHPWINKYWRDIL